MAKVIERNVPIAEENVTLSGQPATNMFEDWSEEMTDKAEILMMKRVTYLMTRKKEKMPERNG